MPKTKQQEVNWLFLDPEGPSLEGHRTVSDLYLMAQSKTNTYPGVSERAQLELDSGKVLWVKRKKNKKNTASDFKSWSANWATFSGFTLHYSKTSLVWNNWEKEKCPALQTKIRSYIIFWPTAIVLL